MDFSAVSKAGGRPVRVRRPNHGAVVARIDAEAESGRLAIPDTVDAELRFGVKRAFDAAASSFHATVDQGDQVVEAALARYNLLHGRFGIANHRGRLEEIGRMYACIWDDPLMAGEVDQWQCIKERHGRGAVRPSLDTHRADFMILSTAAALAAQEGSGTAELLTCDHDFLEFADAILERFGVVVVDCTGLP